MQIVKCLQSVFIYPLDGMHIYIAGAASNAVLHYALSAAFDLTTATYEGQFPVTAQETSLRGVSYSSDGRKCLSLGGQTALCINMI